MLAPPGQVINAPAGMGYIFTSGNLPVRIARILIQGMIWVCLRGRTRRLIVRNDDDAESLVQSGLISPDCLTVIRGSGVDLDKLLPMPEPKIAPGGPVVAAVVSRMLQDKGIREVVLAARRLKLRNIPVKIQLVGEPDPDNPSSISEKTLRQWDREGCIEWLGIRRIFMIFGPTRISPCFRPIVKGCPSPCLKPEPVGGPLLRPTFPAAMMLWMTGSPDLSFRWRIGSASPTRLKDW
jgi:hypothetical protein